MPFIRVETNIAVADRAACLRKISGLAVDMFGKPEAYVMAVFEPEKPILFGGSDDPAAFVTLGSIGLPEGRTPELSAAICAFLHAELAIPENRIYIDFNDIQRHLFGWDGHTF